MTSEAVNLIAAEIDDADDDVEKIQNAVSPTKQSEKTRLLIENCDPHRTVAALRDILSKSGVLYDRGVPVRLVVDQMHVHEGGEIPVERLAEGCIQRVDGAVSFGHFMTNVAGDLQFDRGLGQ